MAGTDSVHRKATYTYNSVGQMTAMDFSSAVRNNDAEDVATFGYDRSGQLLSGDRANASDDEAYAYDGAGNRTSANGATYTTTANNRLTDDGTFTYTYRGFAATEEMSTTEGAKGEKGPKGTFYISRRGFRLLVHSRTTPALASYTSTFDTAGGIIASWRVTNGLSNTSESAAYDYDRTHQLLTADRPGTTAETYQVAGTDSVNSSYLHRVHRL